MTDQIDRAELRRLCEAATPGPWQWVKDGCECFARGIHIHETYEDDPPIVRLENFREEENAAFIAAARTALPALLDALDEEEAMTSALNGDVTEMEQKLEAAEARERKLREALTDIARGDYSDPMCKRTPEQRARAALAETAP